MPNADQRRTGKDRLQRLQEKYVLVDEKSHPYRLYPPRKQHTEQFSAIMRDKNYIRIMTQIGSNRYIITQWYIFCEKDIWICGDAMVLNAHPEKKILCQPICILTRKECPCYYEDSHEFLIQCPSCNNVHIALKNTHWTCPDCRFVIKYDLVNKAPFLTLDCEFCPVHCGWEKVNELNEKDPKFYKSKLQLRKEVIAERMEQDVEDMRKELLDA